MARGGYRMLAATDRCAADFDLRQVRKRIAAGRRSLQDARRRLETATEERARAREERLISVTLEALQIAERTEAELVEELARRFPQSGRVSA